MCPLAPLRVRFAPQNCPAAYAICRNGQINFSVILKDGYTLKEILIDGDYKNLKDQGNGIWRITKVASDLTVSIITEQTEEKEVLDFRRLSGSTRYAYCGNGRTVLRSRTDRVHH